MNLLLLPASGDLLWQKVSYPLLSHELVAKTLEVSAPLILLVESFLMLHMRCRHIAHLHWSCLPHNSLPSKF